MLLKKKKVLITFVQNINGTLVPTQLRAGTKKYRSSVYISSCQCIFISKKYSILYKLLNLDSNHSI